MKKFLTILLTLSMLTAMSAPAMAEEALEAESKLASAATVSEAILSSAEVSKIAYMPLDAKIPLTLSEATELTTANFTVKAGGKPVAADAYSVSTTDNINYLLSFTKAMKDDTDYVIACDSATGEVTYHTTYKTDKYTLTTSQRTVALTAPSDRIAMNLFADFEGVTGNYWSNIDLADSSAGMSGNEYNTRISVQFSNYGKTATTHALQALARGIATKNNLPINNEFSRTIKNFHIVYNKGVVYVYNKNADGTYSMFGKNDMSSWAADYTFDTININSSKFTINAGDGVNIVAVSSTAANAEYLPLDAKVPLTFSDAVAIEATDVSVKANGEAVDNFSLAAVDESNYILNFDGGLLPDSTYTIKYQGAETVVGEITFTTANFVADAESLSGSGYAELSRGGIRDAAIHFKLDSENPGYTLDDGYFYLNDTTSEPIDNYTYKNRLWIRFNRVKEDGEQTDKYSILLYRIINDALFAADRQLATNLDFYKENDLCLILNNNIMYLYVKQADGTYSLKKKYNLNDSTTKPLVGAEGFTFGHMGLQNTAVVAAQIGYPDAAEVEVGEVNAQKNKTIKLSFTNEIVSKPTTITIGGVTAAVSGSGKEVTLTLQDSLSYLTEYEIPLSQFVDKFGQSVEKVKITTPKMPEMYRLENVTLSPAVITEGTLTVSADITKVYTDAPTTATMVAAVYKEVGGKKFLVGINAVETGTLSETALTVTSPAFTIGAIAAGETYSAKVYLWKDIANAYPYPTSH